MALSGWGCAPGPPPALPDPAPPPIPPAPAQREPAPAEVAPSLRPCDAILSIEVRKSERVLEARCVGGALRRMTVALGREARGHKERAGDLRTPEGRYRVVGTVQPSRFHGFLAIDYPSPVDAEKALAVGRISTGDYRRIVAAHERGELPPADTPIGGKIGFHGEGERWQDSSEHLDWTYGCLAVPDATLDFLAERVAPGTPVHILP